MRCSCPDCGEFMINAESLAMGCVCPACGRRCAACLGTNTLLQKEEFKKLERLLFPSEDGREGEQ